MVLGGRNAKTNFSRGYTAALILSEGRYEKRERATREIPYITPATLKPWVGGVRVSPTLIRRRDAR